MNGWPARFISIIEQQVPGICIISDCKQLPSSKDMLKRHAENDNLGTRHNLRQF